MGGSQYRVRGTTQAIIRSPAVRPDRYFCVFKKAVHGTMSTAAAGAFANSTLKLNSLNDPLGSAGSGAPTGSSFLLGAQGSAIYAEYRVHAARVKLEFTVITQTTTSSAAAAVGINPSLSGTAPTSVDQMSTSPRGLSKVVEHGNGPVKFDLFYKIGALAGRGPQDVATNPEFAADYNQDPSWLLVLNIGRIDLNAATQLVLGVKIEIIQYAELFAPNLSF